MIDNMKKKKNDTSLTKEEIIKTIKKHYLLFLKTEDDDGLKQECMMEVMFGVFLYLYITENPEDSYKILKPKSTEDTK